MKRLFSFFICGATLPSTAQEVLGGSREAFALMPAVVIANGKVVDIQYSPSGQQILYRRIGGKDLLTLNQSVDRKATSRTYVYNVKTAKTKEIPIGDAESQLEFKMLSDDRTVFFVDKKFTDYQGFFNLETGEFRRTKLDFDSIRYFGSTAGSSWLLCELPNNKQMIVRPSGEFQTLALSDGIRFDRAYREDGSFIYAIGTGSIPGTYFDLEIRKSDYAVKVKPLSREVLMKQEDESLLYRLRLSTDGEFISLRYNPGSKEGQFSKIVLPRSVILAIEDRCRAQLSPTYQSICFTSGGALLFREIISIDLKVALKVDEERQKEQAIQDAKQIGEALISYCSDMEGELPSPDEFKDRIKPYLRNPKILNGFTYNSRYKNGTDIASPSSEEVGFTSGPGGRAVLYADGSVRWKPN